MQPNAVLIGYLRGDLNVRPVRRPTRTVRRWDPITERWEEHEAIPTGPEYATTTLITYHRQNDCRVIARRRALAWNDGGQAWHILRAARRGEQVRVIGYEETVVWTDGQGRKRQLKYFVVTRCQIIPPEPTG